jgi:hypothetical protein
LDDDEEESDDMPRYKRRGANHPSDENPSPKSSKRNSSSSLKASVSIPAIQRRIRAQADRPVLPLKHVHVPTDVLEISDDFKSKLDTVKGQLQCVILTAATGMRVTRDKPGRKRSCAELEGLDLHNSLQIFDENASLVASVQNVNEKVPELSLSLIEAISYASFVDVLSVHATIDTTTDVTPIFDISICLPTSSLTESTTQVVSAGSQREISCLRDIFSWIYPNVQLSTTKSLHEDFSNTFTPSILYDAIRPAVQTFRTQPSDAGGFEHPNLVSKLRPYQERAVKWLLHRENRTGDSVAHSEEADAFWVPYTSLDGSPFFFDHYSGCLAKSHSPLCADVKGGILSDEMGLGKTVEVISLLLMNKRPQGEISSLQPKPERADADSEHPSHHDEVRCYCGDDNPVDEDLDFVQCDACLSWQHMRCVAFDQGRESNRAYICPECAAKTDPIDVGTTLIVCPDTILSQWEEEIVKHTKPGSVNVLVYGGIRSGGKQRAVRPIQFTDYDVVLTTYNVLREELAHLNAVWTNERVSRMKKKYRSLPSPLTGCRWWRLAIDESQKIGEGTAGAAQMASTLQAINRWAVSGTPIQRGLEDLYGLLLFLKLGTY